MGVNYNKIKGRMRELGMTQEDVVNAMCENGTHICIASLKNRLLGKVDFKFSEFISLMQILQVDDYRDYITMN